MSKPWLLDLMCGAGGCTRGYQRAGFYVVGVDREEQPNYCGDDFAQKDALELLDGLLSGRRRVWERVLEDFAVIHASPPCQPFTRYRNRHEHVRPALDLIEPIRERLIASGLPYVIENVEGAPLEPGSLMLCGSSFGLPIRRHRYFESNMPLMGPPCAHGWQTGLRLYPPATNRKNNRNTVEIGTWRIPVAVQEEAMEIDWMDFSTRKNRPRGGSGTFGSEFSQAIPPAYTELIGHQLLQHITTPTKGSLTG